MKKRNSINPFTQTIQLISCNLFIFFTAEVVVSIATFEMKSHTVIKLLIRKKILLEAYVIDSHILLNTVGRYEGTLTKFFKYLL